MAVTIYDVAREANVSMATVSVLLTAIKMLNLQQKKSS